MAIIYCFAPNSGVLKYFVEDLAEYYGYDLKEPSKKLVNELVSAKKLELSVLDNSPLWHNIKIDDETKQIVAKVLRGKALIIIADESDISYAYIAPKDFANILAQISITVYE